MATNTPAVYNQDDLEALKTGQEVIDYFRSLGVDISDNEADGIKDLPILDKETLIDRPFILISWRFNQGNFGDFVSAEIMDGNGERGILNDGSTGIRDQLIRLTDYRESAGHPTPYAGRMVKGGVRISRYEKEIEDGKGGSVLVPAETFYLKFS